MKNCLNQISFLTILSAKTFNELCGANFVGFSIFLVSLTKRENSKLRKRSKCQTLSLSKQLVNQYLFSILRDLHQ